MSSNKSSILCAIFALTVFLSSSSVCNGAPVETNTLSAADIVALTNSTDLADILANAGDLTIYNETKTSNGTEKQLYVIKAVVYEIGILTEVDDNSTESNESHERVDLTFFDAHKNGSFFDFGDIPVPIQANITGHMYTEILPLHVGDGGIMNLSDIASIIPLSEHVLNFTHNDDTLFQYQETPVHHHHHNDTTTVEEPIDVAAVNQPLEEVHHYHHQHVSQHDLLKIPVIQNSIVIDWEDSASSSSEEDVQQLNSQHVPKPNALGESQL